LHLDPGIDPALQNIALLQQFPLSIVSCMHAKTSPIGSQSLSRSFVNDNNKKVAWTQSNSLLLFKLQAGANQDAWRTVLMQNKAGTGLNVLLVLFG
jgi:hypothetical protein